MAFRIKILILLALLVAVIPAAAYGASGFEVHFIDVGQADAAVVLCDGHVMMIDGGNAADSSLVYSYLKNTLMVSHIDYMICTHAHEDHVGGLSGALNACTVGEVLSPTLEYNTKTFKSFVRYAALQGKSLRLPAAGGVFALGSATAQVLGPLDLSYKNENDRSIVLRLVYGGTSFLFMGDAEAAAESDIIAASRSGMYALASNLIKIGHHGRDKSTSLALLREASPEYAVISAGADGDYGHPSQSVLDRLAEGHVTTYRTDLDGHIICRSDGKTLTFTTQKERRTADAP